MNKYDAFVCESESISDLRWLSAFSKLKLCVRLLTIELFVYIIRLLICEKKDILNEIRNKISIGALCLVFYLLLANTTAENTVLICVHSHFTYSCARRRFLLLLIWSDRTVNIPQSTTFVDFTKEWGLGFCFRWDDFFAGGAAWEY